MKMLQMNAFS